MKPLPPMPPTVDRRPYRDDEPDGVYVESDNDWCANNHEAVTWFIDNHAAIRVAVTGDAGMLAVLMAALSVLDDVRGNINPERGFAEELEADVTKVLRELCVVIGKYDGAAP